jgi:hypothetical protein
VCQRVPTFNLEKSPLSRAMLGLRGNQVRRLLRALLGGNS